MTLLDSIKDSLDMAETSLMFQFLTSHYRRAIWCTNASPAYLMDRFLNEWFGVDKLSTTQLRDADYFKSFYLAMCAGQIATATYELHKLMNELKRTTSVLENSEAHRARCMLASYFQRRLGAALSFLSKDWMEDEVRWFDKKTNKYVIEPDICADDIFDALQMGYGLASDDNFTRARLIVAARRYREMDVVSSSQPNFYPKDLGIDATNEFLDAMFKPYSAEEREEFMKEFAEDGTVNPQISFAIHEVNKSCSESKTHYAHYVKNTRIGILDPCCDDRVMIDIFERDPDPEWCG